MATKFFLVLCASAAIVSMASARCYDYGNAPAWNGASLVGAEIAAAEIGATIGATVGSEIAAANNIGYGYSAPSYNRYAASPAIYTGPAIASTSGGPLSVSVSSAIAPGDVTLTSENAIEGFLEVFGSLPVLAAVAFDGAVPSSGSAGTSYSSGSGSVGMSSESLAAAGLGAGRAPAKPFRAGAGYSAAIADAELAGFSAGLSGARLAGARLPRPTCGCGSY